MFLRCWVARLPNRLRVAKVAASLLGTHQRDVRENGKRDRMMCKISFMNRNINVIMSICF